MVKRLFPTRVASKINPMKIVLTQRNKNIKETRQRVGGGGGGWSGPSVRGLSHSWEKRTSFARKGIPISLILSPHTLLAIKRLCSDLRQSLILAMFLKVETWLSRSASGFTRDISSLLDMYLKISKSNKALKLYRYRFYTIWYPGKIYAAVADLSGTRYLPVSFNPDQSFYGKKHSTFPVRKKIHILKNEKFQCFYFWTSMKDFQDIEEASSPLKENIQYRTSKQCCGSMTFWGGSGSGSSDPCLRLMDPDPGSGSCYFRHWPSRCQQKTNFLIPFFLLITFWSYIYIIFQR